MARARDTRANLVEAAIAEFGEQGFEGTNTNRIARRAGYAPQTFYRHFPDKLALFLVVYRQWYLANIETVSNAADRRTAAQAVVASHRKMLRFRRSLRQLANSERDVAQARATSRNLQIDQLARGLPQANRAQLAALLLSIERIADAIAEGEFADLGIDDDKAVEQLAAAMNWLAPRARSG